MATFPIGLPQPTSDGYGGQQDATFIRTEMESGSQRQRQRYTASNEQLTLSWIFTPSDMSTFRQFYNNSINKGADFFTISLDIGEGMVTYDARFTQPYQYNRLSGYLWNVSANIEVRGG